MCVCLFVLSTNDICVARQLLKNQELGKRQFGVQKLFFVFIYLFFEVEVG